MVTIQLCQWLTQR